MATEEELADILGALEDDDEWNDQPRAGPSTVQNFTGAAAHNMSPSSDEDIFSESGPKVTVFESNTAKTEPTPGHLAALKKYFGHGEFRPLQWKIVSTVLEEKRDSCVVMSTGYGKSLCYQFPPVYTGGVAIIISPLISLMEDQVLKLTVSNIPACFLGSAQMSASKIRQQILDGEHRLIYMSPEFCSGEGGASLLKEMAKTLKMELIAIDEAHCVSQWGHDFRPSYRNLGRLRDIFPSVPFLAVTATATPQVRRDICKSLKLKNPSMTCSSFDRPNLFLSVDYKSDSVVDDMMRLAIKENNAYKFDGATIIYCPTKKETESVTRTLEAMKIPCGTYHAGLSLSTRKDVHEKFVKDKIQVVVATVAFGMGIDKPDVRRVIHYGAPKDIEAYYQEIGRAGRDGMPSTCQVLYSTKDFATSKFFLNDVTNPKHREHKEEMMGEMTKYLETAALCRRQMLLTHFEGKAVKLQPDKECCDNCIKVLRAAESGKKISNDMHDFASDAKMLIQAVQEARGQSSLSTVILILRGSNSKKILQRNRTIESYGIGKHRSEAWWKSLGNLLLREKYFDMKTLQGWGANKFPVTYLENTNKAKNFLLNIKENPNMSLMFEPPREIRTILQDEVAKREKRAAMVTTPFYDAKLDNEIELDLEKFRHNRTFAVLNKGSSTQEATTPVNKEELEKEKLLYDELIKLRANLAQDLDIMPYMITNNKGLAELAKIRPSTEEDLLKVSEFNEAKVEKFGKALLHCILSFSKEHNLPIGKQKVSSSQTNTQLKPKPGMSSSQEMQQILEVIINLEGSLKLKIANLKDKQRITYVAFHMLNKTLEEVAVIREVKIQTVIGDLSEAIKIGLPMEVDRLGITKSDFAEITSAAKRVGLAERPLSAMKELCNPNITFEMLKIGLAIQQFEQTCGVEGKYFQTKSPEVIEPKEEIYVDEDPFSEESETVTSHEKPAATSTQFFPTTEAKRQKLETGTSRAHPVSLVPKDTSRLFDSDDDDDLLNAADELERSIAEENQTLVQSSQDIPSSMGSKKIRKLFSSSKVRI